MQDFKVYVGSELEAPGAPLLWKGAVRVLDCPTMTVTAALPHVDWNIKVTDCGSFWEHGQIHDGFDVHMEADSEADIKLAFKSFLDALVRIRLRRCDLEANIIWDNEIGAFAF